MFIKILVHNSKQLHFKVVNMTKINYIFVCLFLIFVWIKTPSFNYGKYEVNP